MRWAKRVVANTEVGLSAWGIGPEKGRVVPNGFDWSRLNGVKERSSSSNGHYKVVMTGRMAPQKDYRTFFEAGRLLTHRALGRWRFVAVGDGPERGALIAHSRDLIDAGVAEFPEPCSEVIDKVAVADAGVLMTCASIHAEGCSNSILEYMACGLPVICSEGGGNRELVTNGETGFLVPPGDARLLAEKLLWLRETPAPGAEMGKRAKQVVAQRYSVENMLMGMIAVYNEVVSRSNGS